MGKRAGLKRSLDKWSGTHGEVRVVRDSDEPMVTVRLRALEPERL